MTKIKELLDSWLLIQPGSKRHTQQLSPQPVAAWNHACHALFSQHSRTRGALSKWQPSVWNGLCLSISHSEKAHLKSKPDSAGTNVLLSQNR